MSTPGGDRPRGSRRSGQGAGRGQGTGRPAGGGRPDDRRRRAAGGYRPPPVDPSRQAAYDVLTAVRERDAYANLVLPGLLSERRLDTRDAALATELAYGTLRGRGLYDAVLQACVDRPLAEVDPPVLDVLRLGAHQLLRTRIPTHASVSATVDLARRVLSAGPVGFVNAVLRKVAAQDVEAWIAQLRPEEPLEALAFEHSHPRWIVSAFRDALRGSLEQTAAALAADDARPEVHLVARRMPREELIEVSGGRPGPWSPHAVRLSEGDPGGLEPVRDGRAGVQDEGSQLVALALARAPLDGPDRLWVDLCSGPGGKASLLDAVAGQRGARLLALEVQPHRAGLVQRSGVPLVVTADARRPPLRPGSVDRIVLDAPCSGLGALRRRPEARWRRQPSDLPGLTRLQRELLDSAAILLRPGGVLVYATCSPHLAETAVPVADALRRHPELEQVDVRPLLDGVPHLGDGPAVQLWPHRHGTDAMFLALLRHRV
ncbi:MAG TPA: transcription antitermination factor NusB [Mycobacteriales bacterium]|nr:transcription antitermination factor NusB [Mycobacteriales bacterium]